MRIIMLFVFLFISACTVTSTSFKTVTETPVPVEKSDVIQKLKDIGSSSSCAKVNWKNRGTSPAGYPKGMAVLYAKQYCNQFRSDVQFISEKSERSGDVLNHYADKLSEAKLSKESPLRQTWVILMGLGMMESSGSYCCGKDMSPNAAKFATADAAEAGLWQTSWDVSAAHEELKKAFKRHETDDSGCYMDIFKEGVSDKYCANNAANYGDPNSQGYKFQKREKECPGLAGEFAAITVRVSGGAKGHYGPLRSREAEVRKECSDMFAQVEKFIEENPLACNSF